MTAGWPRSVRRAHWSRMSAISGETTTVRSSPASAGQLVAEALAAARRHDDERVAAIQGGLHGVALAGAERRQPEQPEQRLGGDVGQRLARRGGARGRRGGLEQRRRGGSGLARGAARRRVEAAGSVEVAIPGGLARRARGRVEPRGRPAVLRLGVDGRLHRGEVGEVGVLVGVAGRRRRGPRGGHALGRELGDRRQRRALAGRQLRPAPAQVVERVRRSRRGGIGEDGGEDEQRALHVSGR